MKPTLTIALLFAMASAAQAQPKNYIRINQLGYLPNNPKIAVVCSLEPATISTFTIQDNEGKVVYGPRKATPSKAFAACVSTHRLDFTGFIKPG